MASINKIKNIDMMMITDRIKEGRCIPFLGAGANVGCKKRSYEGLPLGNDVAKELANQISFIGRDPEDLARVTLEYEFQTDRSFLIKSLKSILNYNKCKTSPLLRIISKLPFKFIVTTNFDRLMERALSEEKRSLR